MRGLMVLVAVAAILTLPFARRVKQANDQQACVSRILSRGGIVLYDFHTDGQPQTRRLPSHPKFSEPRRSWQRRILGGDYFDSVMAVSFGAHSDEVPVDALLELPHLRHVLIRNRPISRQEIDGLKQLRTLVELDLQGTNIREYLELVEALPGCNFRR